MNKENLRLLQQRVTLLRSEGKYKETIESCYYLLKCGIESNDYKSILTAHINNAASYYCIGDLEEAFKSIDSYDRVCSKYGDDSDKLNLYNTLFVLYEYNNDYYKAKETLIKSIDLGKKLEKYNIVSNAYSNYSHILINELNYKEALEMGKIGLEMAKLHKPASMILKIRVQLNIILAQIGLKNFDVSGQLLEQIINDPILDSFIREKVQCHILQGEWYSNQNLYMEAFKSLTYAKELVESYDDLYLLKEIQEKRCKMCELMNDIPQGYLVQREYIELLNLINEKKLAITALKLDIKHNIAAIERKANTDYLTGLYNRSYLEAATTDWLKEASVEKESIACIVFDIDNFKGINDKYGHLLGDDVIKQISKSCSSIISDHDLIGRYGGDEFVIVLRRSSLEDGYEIAKRLKHKLLNLNIKKSEKTIPINVSMGVADNLNGSILSFNDLFHLADMRLYKAKQNGKDQICAFG
ncbi:GGDEF domain-containing protein [Tissierella sp.]|uniref:GGDEF domain-containing protein n=1 Tax=Tissierella sp. TaxID=41274 RepID=UPI0028665657|nr:GGDEF domain-containing protein [Tissierella sp.]MDR7855015.1 GGDEF domain-containing protein [Tissierella sp.]